MAAERKQNPKREARREAKQETIVERVKKLQRLAAHPATNVEEVGVATAMAARLIFQYAIEEEELRAAGDKASDGYIKRPIPATTYKQYRTLLSHISSFNFCTVVWVKNDTFLVGQPAYIEATLLSYERAKDTISSLCSTDWCHNKLSYEERGTTKAHHWTAFWYGALRAVYSHLDADRKQTEADANKRALVVSKQSELAEANQQLFGEVKIVNQRARLVDSEAYKQGFKAGWKAIPTKPHGGEFLPASQN